ncbi:hypothetical protein [Mycobacterium sp. 852002-51163_SCH5372311]|nr:hypothetical protein [Mycobacterium sp. 852002-51163_SCH5372311]
MTAPNQSGILVQDDALVTHTADDVDLGALSRQAWVADLRFSLGNS